MCKPTNNPRYYIYLKYSDRQFWANSVFRQTVLSKQCRTGSQGYEINANKSQITNNCKNSLLLNIAEHENFSANKYENATIVGIFIFISGENFMLSWVEHEKSFISSEPDQTPQNLQRLVRVYTVNHSSSGFIPYNG